MRVLQGKETQREEILSSWNTSVTQIISNEP